MDKLFFRYAVIHQRITKCEVGFPVLQICSDRFVLISDDMFSHSGDYEEVKNNLEQAIANNQLLENKGG